MKKSIANKIESLLAKMTSSEAPEKQDNMSKDTKRQKFGKFCRSIPVSLFNLIRPAQRFDFKQDV